MTEGPFLEVLHISIITSNLGEKLAKRKSAKAFLSDTRQPVLHSIESIQRHATRLICGSEKSYSERLTELNWSTLELRRKYLCLVQLYKIIHGYCDIYYTTYVDLTGPTRTRSNHDFKIRPRAARTNYFKFSYLNRYVNGWNSLPNSVVCFQLELF